MNDVFSMIEEYIPISNAQKQKDNGDFLILSNHDAEIYYLNGMAKEMWYMLDGTMSIKSIYNKIHSEYEVDENELQNDLLDFIRDLQWKRLIRLMEG